MDPHILIIEDDPFLKEFYEFVFRKMKWKLTLIEDGDRFIKFLDEEEIALIIMDINLKNTSVKGEKVDGVFLSRYVKQNEKYAKIPILIVSAYSLDKSSSKIFVDSMADDYFTKPITDINEFLSQIKKFVE
ncbi:MAG: hypothetical protein CVV23_06010 [Ignavibacteriae bacterium HGW-Ignavibacteriae-2]|jgi:DNA-binding response OmpR family regulator|nr:MAG: hypothetical protein CVV23_06010 [Ignavibacteriae bacterium HGW-Ignavibacteriae-2]